MKSLDIFGFPVNVKINGNYSFKSKTGAYITIFMLITFIIVVSLFSQEFIKRESPRNIIEDRKTNNPSLLNLFQNKFYFSIGVGFNTTSAISSNILKINAYLKNIQDSSVHTESSVNIDLVPCTKDKFKGLENEFNSLHLENTFCPEFNENFTVFGSFVNKNYQYLSVQITLCDSSKYNCTSLNEIEKRFNKYSPKAHIYFIDSSIDTQNYHNPIKYFINNFNIDITFGDFKESDIFLRQTQLFSSNGRILNENLQIYKALSFFEWRDKISVRAHNKLEIVTFNIKAGNSQLNINRFYIKLPELLASISSVCNLIYLFCYIFAKHVNKYMFVKEIVSKLFYFKNEKTLIDFDEIIQNELEKKKNNIQNLEYSNTYFNNQVNKNINIQIIGNNNNEEIEQNDEKNKIEENSKSTNKYQVNEREKKEFLEKNIRKSSILKRKQNIYKITKCEKFKFIFGFCLKKKILKNYDYFEKIMKQVDKYLDFGNIVKKIQEIDILKYILLDKNQINLYNFIRKPIIFQDEINNDDFTKEFNIYSKSTLHSMEEIKKLKSNEITQIIQSFNEILNKNQLSEKDKKIIKALHPEIKKMISVLC